MLPRFDAAVALTAIGRCRVGWVNLVPTMMLCMWRLIEAAPGRYDLSSLRTVPTGITGEIYMRAAGGDRPPPLRRSAGRRTDRILVGGANVYPAEIESVIMKCPGVLSCAVVGLPDEDLGHRPHAMIQFDRLTVPFRTNKPYGPFCPNVSPDTSCLARFASSTHHCAKTRESCTGPPKASNESDS